MSGISKHVQRSDCNYIQVISLAAYSGKIRVFNTDSLTRSYTQGDVRECPLDFSRNQRHLVLLLGMPHTQPALTLTLKEESSLC